MTAMIVMIVTFVATFESRSINQNNLNDLIGYLELIKKTSKLLPSWLEAKYVVTADTNVSVSRTSEKNAPAFLSEKGNFIFPKNISGRNPKALFFAFWKIN